MPAKYLVPGTLFLLAFQVVPVLYTVSTAFTNFGDGHRGSKQEAIVAIETASVTQAPGSAEYQLTVATTGDPAAGRWSSCSPTPTPAQISSAPRTGLRPLPTQ